MNLQQWLTERHGRGTELAQAIGVAQPLISRMAAGQKTVPIARCISIERATGGAVTRKDLRPDDWADIWPEAQAHSWVPAAAATPQPTEPAAVGV